MTPYNPTAASSSAIPEKTVISLAMNRWEPLIDSPGCHLAEISHRLASIHARDDPTDRRQIEGRTRSHGPGRKRAEVDDLKQIIIEAAPGE